MDFVSALKDPGYRSEQVSKILVTHTHRDPTGELSSFPSAKLYNAQEDADALNLKGDSSIRVSYKDDAFRMAVFLLDKHHEALILCSKTHERKKINSDRIKKNDTIISVN